MSLPQWEITQERTFARWCNHQLKKRNITIADNGLCDGLATGTNLNYLLEELSHQTLKGTVPKPSTRFQQLANCSLGLKFVTNEGIKLAAIGPEDVVDKKRKLVMGLIWTLILKYQVGKGEGGAEDAMKSELLKWVQNQVKPYNTPVNNFGNDWSDGRVLCALVNSLHPNAINMSSLNDPYQNSKKGIDSAESDLLIPRIMEPEDFSNGNPDENSVVTYVSLFRDAMNSRKSAAPASPAQTAPIKKPTGSGAIVEVFLSLATSSTKIKKDIQSLKFLLDKKGVKYLEYDVGTNAAKKEEAFAKSGTKVLPQLFIDGKYIGDYEAAQLLEETGDLNPLLGIEKK